MKSQDAYEAQRDGYDAAMERIGEALQAFDERMRYIGGCGDGYCLVTGKAAGQHTNGGCRCATNKMTAQRVMNAARTLRDALAETTR